jgi:alanine dehydrogenase
LCADDHLAQGLNLRDGKITHQPVAKALGCE